MRLYLSDKAARALKNLPPEDYMECEEHGRQRYARTPKPLVESRGEWMCGECLKSCEDELAELTRAKREEESAAKEAKKAAKKAAQSATSAADESLAEQLSTCKDRNRQVRELQQGLKALITAQATAEEQIADARARIEQAQRDLAEAEALLAESAAKVPGVEAELETERGRLDVEVAALQERLTAADEAWKELPPRQRKKRDRRSRHSAVQIVNANKRWHERRDGAEGDDEVAEAGEPTAASESIEAVAAATEAEAATAAEAATEAEAAAEGETPQA